MPQHHGLQTCKSVKQKVGASADPERAALYRFLASMIDPCIDSFDEEPLPIHVADKVFGARIVLARSSRQGAQVGRFARGPEIVIDHDMWQTSCKPRRAYETNRVDYS